MFPCLYHDACVFAYVLLYSAFVLGRMVGYLPDYRKIIEFLFVFRMADIILRNHTR